MTPWFRRSLFQLTAAEVAALTFSQADAYLMDMLRETEQQGR